MQVQMMSPSLLKPYPNNPRRNKHTVEAVVKSIQKFGFRQPIVVDKDNIIIVGHVRWQAAIELELQEVPVHIADLSAEDARAYRLADNKIGELSSWNNQELIGELSALTNYNMVDFGYDQLEIDKILSSDIPKSIDWLGSDQKPLLEPGESKTPELVAPINYFGGKRRIANAIWKLIGYTERYIEPFAGSAAVLLARPAPIVGTEIINDINHYVVNFWRALSAEPDKLAHLVNYPVCEADLHARHIYLTNGSDELNKLIYSDCKAYDIQKAAWWAWGVNIFQHPQFCDGKVGNKLPSLAHTGGIDAIAGVGNLSERYNNLSTEFKKLSDRLNNVKICCGDWKRVVSYCVAEFSDATAAIFLDPPYENFEYVYGPNEINISKEVRAWCVEQAQTNLKIILTGYNAEHDELLKYGYNSIETNLQTGMKINQDKKMEKIWYKL